MLADTTLQQNDKTRNAILNAFASLLVERGYGCLTVKDILERASIGRTTFYEYFRSKEELLQHSIGRLGEALRTQGELLKKEHHSREKLAFTLPFFRHVGSEHGVYNTIVGREELPIFERYIRRMLAGLVLNEIRSYNADLPTASSEVASQYVAGALLSTVAWWKENRGLFTPEEINLLFRKMALPGLDALLDESRKV